MHPLDNPIFNALGTCQANFAETYGVLRRFPPEVTPLGGFPEPNAEGFAAVRGLLAGGGGLGLFLPSESTHLRALRLCSTAVCCR